MDRASGLGSFVKVIRAFGLGKADSSFSSENLRFEAFGLHQRVIPCLFYEGLLSLECFRVPLNFDLLGSSRIRRTPNGDPSASITR